MSDTKKTVEIEFIANAAKVREEMKKTAAEAKKLGGVRGGTLAGDKTMPGISGNQAKAMAKEISRQEKLYAQQLKKLNDEVKKQIREKQRAGRTAADPSTGLSAAAARAEREDRRKREAARKKQDAAWARDQYGGGRGQGGNRGGNVRSSNSRGGMGALGMGAAAGIGFAAVGLASDLVGSFINVVKEQVSASVAAKREFGVAYGGLVGTGANRGQLSQAVQRGERFGYSGIETANQARGVARATGSIEGTGTAQAMSRAFGMDVGEATGFMGTLTQAGKGFGGKAGASGKRELVQIMSMGMASGLDRARMPEFMDAIGGLVQQQGTRSAGAVDAAGISQIMAAFGASGKAGMQGARGAAVISGLDQGIKGPGGGEAGQALVMRAMGFGGPNGSASYYEALKKQEQGVTGKGGVDNLKALFAQTRQEYGGGEAQILALKELTPLSIEQLEAAREIVEGNLSNAEQQKKLQEIADQSKSIEEQALSAMKSGFGDVILDQAEQTNRLIANGAPLEESVLRIRDAINRLVDHFMPEIVMGLEVIASGVEWLSDALTKKFSLSYGKDAQKEMTGLTEGMADLVNKRRSGEITKDQFASESGKLVAKGRILQRQLGGSGHLVEQMQDAMFQGNAGSFGIGIDDVVGADNRRQLWGKTMHEQRDATRARVTNQTDILERQRAISMNQLDPLPVESFTARSTAAGAAAANQANAATPDPIRQGEQFTRIALETQQQSNQILAQTHRTLQAIEAASRDAAEGPASTSRRSGNAARIDTSGGVSNAGR